MSTDPGETRAAWRPACECALALCAAWLVVQNLALGIALLVDGPGAAWHLSAPLLGVALLFMAPLWLVPAIALFLGLGAGARIVAPRRMYWALRHWLKDEAPNFGLEVARAGIPTVMLFVQSLRGLSHTKLEDTKREHLALSVQALDRLATKTLARLA